MNSETISFILGATDHAPMIFSRLDYNPNLPKSGSGVGEQLLRYGVFEPDEVVLLKKILLLRKEYYGDKVFAVDCGANVGVHSVEWGRLMKGWGNVLSIESQERIYYALAGNIALNNLLNVKAIHAAVANRDGEMLMEEPDYMLPGSFGMVALKDRHISTGQKEKSGNTSLVKLIKLDNLFLDRCDLIKIDVEGMEEEVIEGGWKTITIHKPILCIEVVWMKDQKETFAKLKNVGYKIATFGNNIIAVHSEDKCLDRIIGN